MTEYTCPICHKPGYMRCEHIQNTENARWIAKQEAIRDEYAGLRGSLNTYYSITGNDPRRTPQTGNHN